MLLPHVTPEYAQVVHNKPQVGAKHKHQLPRLPIHCMVRYLMLQPCQGHLTSCHVLLCCQLLDILHQLQVLHGSMPKQGE